MKKILLVALGGLLAITGLQAAAPPVTEPANADVQDVVYLGEGRPAFIRFHLRGESGAFAARWNTWMSRLFRYYDLNEDGRLDRREAALLPSAEQMQQLLVNGFNIRVNRQGMPSIPFEQIDADRDGVLSPDELRRYYQANGAAPVQLSPSYNYGTPSDTLTDVLITQLDVNQDGKLSREELRTADRLLLRFDTNDDELLSAAELTGTLYPGQYRQVNQPATPAASRLILVPQGEDREQRTARLNTARQILARWDTEGKGKVNLAKSGFSQDQFTALDRNRDGQLDLLELTRWLAGKPEAEYTLQLVARPQGMMMRPQAGGGQARPVQPAVAPPLPSKILQLGNVRLNIASAPSYPQRGGVASYLLQQFRQIDREKKGVLVRAQLNPQQHYYLVQFFEMADRNRDSKLTEEELREFADLLQDAQGLQANFSVLPTGRGLFQLFDVNNDGQLGIRELRTAWDRLAEFDRDGDGAISRAEFPLQFNLMVSAGYSYGYNPSMNFVGGNPTGQPRVSPRGPIWFRKMDRNGDGDVSPNEWLGPRKTFDAIDSNRDGLISVEEAEAGDSHFRKQEK